MRSDGQNGQNQGGRGCSSLSSREGLHVEINKVVCSKLNLYIQFITDMEGRSPAKVEELIVLERIEGIR